MPNVLDIMQEVVDKVSVELTPYLQTINAKYEGVRFDYGHPVDIVGRLSQLSTTDKNRYSKYPLIGLFLDISEKRNERQGIATTATLNGFIAIGTDAKYTPQQRTILSFTPIIHVIRGEFEKQLIAHSLIEKPEGNIYNYDYTDRYQWGKGGLSYYNNGQKEIFNDFIDAGEFTNLQISLINKC